MEVEMPPACGISDVAVQIDAERKGIKGALSLARRTSQPYLDFFKPASQREKPAKLQTEVEVATSNRTAAIAVEDSFKTKKGRPRKKLQEDGGETSVAPAKMDKRKKNSLSGNIRTVELLTGEAGIHFSSGSGVEDRAETRDEEPNCNSSDDFDMETSRPMLKNARLLNVLEGPKLNPSNEKFSRSSSPLLKKGKPRKELFREASESLNSAGSVCVSDGARMKKERPSVDAQGPSQKESHVDVALDKSNKRGTPSKLLIEKGDKRGTPSKLPLVNGIERGNKRETPREISFDVESRTEIPIPPQNVDDPQERGSPKKKSKIEKHGPEIVRNTLGLVQRPTDLSQTVSAVVPEKESDVVKKIEFSRKGGRERRVEENLQPSITSDSGQRDVHLSQSKSCDEFFLPVSKRRMQKNEPTDDKLAKLAKLDPTEPAVAKPSAEFFMPVSKRRKQKNGLIVDKLDLNETSASKPRLRKGGITEKPPVDKVQRVSRSSANELKQSNAPGVPDSLPGKEIQGVEQDLRLESHLAAQENAKLNAGKTTHPFFMKKKVQFTKSSNLLDETASAQAEDCQPCPPIHITQWNEDEDAAESWLGQVLAPTPSMEARKLDDLYHNLEQRRFQLMEAHRPPAPHEYLQGSNLKASRSDSQFEVLATSEAVNLEVKPADVERRNKCLQDLVKYKQALTSIQEDSPDKIVGPEALQVVDDGSFFLELNDRLSWFSVRRDALNSAENVNLPQCTKESGGEAINKNRLWTDMYHPKSSKEVCGNSTTVEFLSSWLDNWQQKINGQLKSEEDVIKDCESDDDWFQDDCDNDSSADDVDDAGLPNTLLITGPEGCGKSAAVYACAGEHGFTVIEVNASDWRNGALIKNKFGEAMESHGLGHAPQAAVESPQQVRKNGIVVQHLESPQQEKKKEINVGNFESPQQVSKKGNVIQHLESPQQENKKEISVVNFESPQQVSKKGCKVQRFGSPQQLNEKGMKAQNLESPQQCSRKVRRAQNLESPEHVIKKVKSGKLESPQQRSKKAINVQNLESPQQVSKMGRRGQNSYHGLAQQDILKKEKDTESLLQQNGSLEERQTETQSKRRTVILFEDVDKHFEEDKGFVTALVHLSKLTKRPIILTSNKSEPGLPQILEKSRIKFSHPALKELVLLASLVCIAEGAVCNPWLVERLVDSCRCDMRKVMMALQFWRQGEDSSQQESVLNRTAYELLKCPVDPERLPDDTCGRKEKSKLNLTLGRSQIQAVQRQSIKTLGLSDWDLRWLFELDVHHFVLPQVFSSSDICPLSLYVAGRVHEASTEQEKRLAQVAASETENRARLLDGERETAKRAEKALKQEQKALRQASRIQQLLLEEDDDPFSCSLNEDESTGNVSDEKLKYSPIKSLREAKSLARSPLKPKILKPKRALVICDSEDEHEDEDEDDQAVGVKMDCDLHFRGNCLFKFEPNCSGVGIKQVEDLDASQTIISNSQNVPKDVGIEQLEDLDASQTIIIDSQNVPKDVGIEQLEDLDAPQIIISDSQNVPKDVGMELLDDFDAAQNIVCEVLPEKRKRLCKTSSLRFNDLKNAQSHCGDDSEVMAGKVPCLGSELESLDPQLPVFHRTESSQFHAVFQEVAIKHDKMEVTMLHDIMDIECTLPDVDNTNSEETLLSNSGDLPVMDLLKIIEEPEGPILLQGPVDDVPASPIIKLPDSREIGGCINSPKVLKACQQELFEEARLNGRHDVPENVALMQLEGLKDKIPQSESADNGDITAHTSLCGGESHVMTASKASEEDLFDLVKKVWANLKDSRQTDKTLTDHSLRNGDVISCLANVTDIMSSSDVISNISGGEFQDFQNNPQGPQVQNGDMVYFSDWDGCQEVASQLVRTGLLYSLNVLPTVENLGRASPSLACILENAKDAAAVGKCLIMQAAQASKNHPHGFPEKVISNSASTDSRRYHVKQTVINNIVQGAVFPRGRVPKSDITEYSAYMSRICQLEEAQRRLGQSSIGRRNRRVGHDFGSKLTSVTESDVTELLASSNYGRS